MAEQGRFVSGEAVELDIRVALVGSRMLAFLIDLLVEIGLLIGLYFVSVLLTLLLLVSELGDLALLIGLVTVSGVFAFVIYPATLETLTGGRSLGKLAVGLRVVRDDGGPIRFRHSLVRVLVGFAVDFPGLALPPVTWLVSLWTALANPHGKRLGDLAGVPPWAFLAAVLAERYRRETDRLTRRRRVVAQLWPGLGTRTQQDPAAAVAPANGPT